MRVHASTELMRSAATPAAFHFASSWPWESTSFLCGVIPLAWQHETVAYGEYANVVRGRKWAELEFD